MEIALLLQYAAQGKKIFVDTNIPLEVLHEIADYDHVAVMLSPQAMSVERFFDREDPEKQFLLRQAEEPEWTMDNFKACIARINSPEHYREYAESGFFTWGRREDSTVEQALESLERHLGLIG